MAIEASSQGRTESPSTAHDLCIEVKPGDNIWSLSERVYGKGIRPLAAIYEENHLPVTVIEDQGKRSFVAPVIRPGDKLLFPSRERVKDLQNEFFSNLNRGATTRGAHPAPDTSKTGIKPSTDAGPNGHQKPADGAPPNDQTPPAVEARPVKAPDHGASPAQAPDWCTRVGHVSEVVADGLIVGALREGIKQSCEDPLGTAARVGTAVALGAAVGIATGGVGFVAEAAGALAMGLTVAGTWDFLNPYDEKNAQRNANVAKCLATAWNAPATTSIDRDDVAMEKELGRPGFDLALGAIGGLAGAKFTRAFLPPPGVCPSPSPMSTALTRLGPSTDLVVRPMSTTIVARELSDDFSNPEHVVDAESVRLLSVDDYPPALETTKGGPKALEDHSKKTG